MKSTGSPGETTGAPSTTKTSSWSAEIPKTEPRGMRRVGGTIDPPMNLPPLMSRKAAPGLVMTVETPRKRRISGAARRLRAR